MGVLSNLIVRIGASTDDFDRKLNASLGKIQRFGASMSQAGQSLSIGFSAPLIAAGAGALAAAADMEKLEKGLTATMKSTAAAGKELERLKVVSKLPGLGLQEAVQGSIRLQTLGSSADESRKIMMELGNALATVGGGNDDFREVIRQLSQLSAVGKVTKENLDPIIERIPQIAAIMREKFGPESIGDPAKTFERLGISSKQFIDIIVAELAKGERAGGTFANSLENLKESAFETAAEFGKSLLPYGKRVLEEFINPGIEKAKELAVAFSTLQPASQDAVVGLTALTVALPLVIVGMGTVIEKAALIGAAFLKVGGVLKATSVAILAASASFSTYVLAQSGIVAGSAAAIGAMGLVAAAFAATAVQAYVTIDAFYAMRAAQANLDTSNKIFSDSTEKLLIQLRGKSAAVVDLEKRYRSGSIGLDEFNKGLILAQRELHAQAPAAKAAATGLDSTSASFNALTAAASEAAGTVQLYGKAAVSSYAEDFKTAVLKERLSLLTSEFSRKLSDGVAALVTYKTAAQAANAALTELRITEEAPSLGGGITDVRRLPTPNILGLPGGAVLDGSDAARSSRRNLELIRQTARGAQDSWRNVRTGISRQVSTIQTDFSRAIVNIIRGTESVGEAFRKVGNAAVDGLLRTGIEFAVNEGIKLLGKLLTSMGGVAAKIGSIFGGSGGGASGSAGGMGGGGGSLGGASSGGALPVIGAVTGVVSAISDVFSNFQFAAMNKTLDLIEKEVRYSQIHLGYILEKQNEYLPKLKDIWESLIRMETRGMSLSGGGAATVTINVNGGDPRQMLEAITRELKQLGVIPK
jgi:tape measure domain-containing protein